MSDLDKRIDELVRDACSVVPVPKSEYHSKLKLLIIDEVVKELGSLLGPYKESPTSNEVDGSQSVPIWDIFDRIKALQGGKE